jgi:uncharacterized protein
MKCPICNVDLVMSERQGIEIDYCPQCRGVWLDRGELDKIIERSVGPSAAPPPPSSPVVHSQAPYPQQAPQPYRQEEYDHHGQGHKKHRKKSFFEDLFD